MSFKKVNSSNERKSIQEMLDISGRVAIITGGAGFLGVKHAEAIIEGGGIPVLVDVNEEALNKAVKSLQEFGGERIKAIRADITKLEEVERVKNEVLSEFGRIDALINNAANNPQMEREKGNQWSRFENFPVSVWNDDLSVGLTGTFLCCQVMGSHMASKGKGVIVNIASDLGLIAPDQRIYKLKGMTEETQPYKPPTYSVIKAGLINFTRYLAVYWAKKGVRVNTLTPASVFNNQDPEFVENISSLIPLGRMSEKNEFKAALLYLVSDASSYMTGSNIVIDGGRTSW